MKIKIRTIAYIIIFLIVSILNYLVLFPEMIKGELPDNPFIFLLGVVLIMTDAYITIFICIQIEYYLKNNGDKEIKL